MDNNASNSNSNVTKSSSNVIHNDMSVDDKYLGIIKLGDPLSIILQNSERSAYYIPLAKSYIANLIQLQSDSKYIVAELRNVLFDCIKRRDLLTLASTFNVITHTSVVINKKRLKFLLDCGCNPNITKERDSLLQHLTSCFHKTYRNKVEKAENVEIQNIIKMLLYYGADPYYNVSMVSKSERNRVYFAVLFDSVPVAVANDKKPTVASHLQIVPWNKIRLVILSFKMKDGLFSLIGADICRTILEYIGCNSKYYDIVFKSDNTNNNDNVNDNNNNNNVNNNVNNNNVIIVDDGDNENPNKKRKIGPKLTMK